MMKNRLGGRLKNVCIENVISAVIFCSKDLFLFLYHFKYMAMSNSTDLTQLLTFQKAITLKTEL